jgi:hypothetical protein
MRLRTVQDGAVYTYVGSENIYQPIAPFPIEDPLNPPARAALWEDNHQSAAVVQDRIHLPGHIQLLAGGRYDSLRDHNYSLSATTSPGTPTTIHHGQAHLAAAIRGHLQPGKQPYALWQLRSNAFAGAARAVVGG